MQIEPDRIKPESWLVSAGRIDEPGAPLNVPPIPASNFTLGAGRGYARGDGTPTWEALEAVLGGLEAGKAVAFSSGMAAVAAVFDQLPAGAVVVLPEDCYQGVVGLAEAGARKQRWSVRRVAVDDTAGWVRACAEADLVWLESPSNPLLTVADLEAICAAPRKTGAIVVVDNTFATPALQQPLQLGADLVVHSATKYLGGHSDVVAGFVATSDDELAERIGFLQNAAGAVLGPFDCYLVHRGVKTLPLRMARHSESAQVVAEALRAHPAVSAVHFPGLPDHPGHEVARRQMRAFGGMVSFQLAGGEAAALEVCRRTELFTLAESLGAVESLIEHPGVMTHASVAGTPNEVPGDLVRLSVGIEDVEDLVADLRQALDGPT